MDYIIVICVSNIVEPTLTILFSIVSTILFSNDEATLLFMAVGTGEVCIDRTTMFTVVVDMPVSTC